jgi:hypothetical protein
MAAAKLTLDLLETTSLEVSCHFFPEPFPPEHGVTKKNYFRFTRNFILLY